MQPSLPQQPFATQSDSIFNSFYTVMEKLLGVNWLGIMYTILALLVIVFITVILYSLVRLYELKQEADKKSRSVTVKPVPPVATGGPTAIGTIAAISRENETWRHIRERLLSPNPSDWRLAIIEADIYMDKVLDTKGFHGDTIGDKLKQITPDQFGSVQIAWEAHKVRNRIAHQGSDFTLTQPESRRVLSYYEIVFRDLEVID
ncbi:hypothetical protein K2Q02_00085 [Patescibacteria group bacterium]|nr:hypothetical protein [Patescibacteria group bacterium]